MNLSLPARVVSYGHPPCSPRWSRAAFSAIEIERGIVREEILEDLDDEGRQIDADNLVALADLRRAPAGLHHHRLAGAARHLRPRDVASATTPVTTPRPTRSSASRERSIPTSAFASRRKHFAALPRGDQVAGVSAAAPSAKKPRLKHVSEHVEPDHASRRLPRPFRAPSACEPALEMLLRVLDDGMSTRLYERICDTKGLCYDVGALYESYEDDGVFDVAAEAQHERVLDVAAEIFAVLRELAEEGPSQAEVDRAKQRHHWQTQAMLDDSDALAGYYALAALSKLVPTPGDRYEQLAAVTQADVRSAAERVFRRQQMGLVTVGGLTAAQQGTLREMVAQFP